VTQAQIAHALKVVDDIHRVRASSSPDGIVPIRSSIRDVIRVQAMIEDRKQRGKR
jgi:hypothetical protein